MGLRKQDRCWPDCEIEGIVIILNCEFLVLNSEFRIIFRERRQIIDASLIQKAISDLKWQKTDDG